MSDCCQYFDPQSGRFFIQPCDVDNTFSAQGETQGRSIYARFGDNALAALVTTHNDLQERYEEKLAAAMSTVAAEMVQAEADRIYAQICDVAYDDPIKMFPNSTFDWNVGYIRDFVAARYANVRDQLAGQ